MTYGVVSFYNNCYLMKPSTLEVIQQLLTFTDILTVLHKYFIPFVFTRLKLILELSF